MEATPSLSTVNLEWISAVQNWKQWSTNNDIVSIPVGVWTACLQTTLEKLL